MQLNMNNWLWEVSHNLFASGNREKLLSLKNCIWQNNWFQRIPLSQCFNPDLTRVDPWICSSRHSVSVKTISRDSPHRRRANFIDSTHLGITTQFKVESMNTYFFRLCDWDSFSKAILWSTSFTLGAADPLSRWQLKNILCTVISNLHSHYLDLSTASSRLKKPSSISQSECLS